MFNMPNPKCHKKLQRCNIKMHVCYIKLRALKLNFKPAEKIVLHTRLINYDSSLALLLFGSVM